MSKQWQSAALGIAMLCVCVGLGIQVAQRAQEVRGLYAQLQQNQLAQDALLAQHSRLLLERAALASYNSVDRLAEYELNMRFPERITRVVH